MGGKRNSYKPPPREPDSPLSLCVATVEICLAKDPPEIAAAQAAIVRYAAECQSRSPRGQALLGMPLAETSLCIRTVNMLDGAGISTVGELLDQPKLRLLSIANCGQRTLEEIYSMLLGLGFAVPSAEDIGMVSGSQKAD
jgi:DNA-directed RNA polymerase alpha subunit